MNLTCNTQALAVELRLLAKIVPAKPTIAMLGYVLLKAEERLTLQATDLEVGLTTKCDARVDAPGAVALPAAKLLAIVEQLPDQDVTIALDGPAARILSGGFKSRLQALPAKDFPVLPAPEGDASQFEANDLRALIGRTRYAVNANSGKHILQGALMDLKDGALAMVATDSKRLAMALVHGTGANLSATIPAKTLDVLASQDGDGVVEFVGGERHLFFTLGERVLNSRMIDGQFPAYQKIIPQVSTKRITVDRVQFSSALKRVGLVSEQNYACYFAFDGGSVEVTSSSAEVGDAVEHVPIAYDGEPIKVCCNWQYVLDFLEAAANQSISMELKDDKSPMLLTDGPSHVGVVMLMRK